MNWPQQQPPPGYPPQQYPPQAPQPVWGQQLIPQQPQQPAAPTFAPQPGYPPQQQPGMFAPPANLQAAGTGNIFQQLLSEPPRQASSRAKPADGTYVVRFTSNCLMKQSQNTQKNFGQWFLLLEYTVLEGTVPQLVGQTFGQAYFWASKLQMQDLADLAKYTFGPNLPQVQAQSQNNPQTMAQMIATTLSQGLFGAVRIHRSQKQLSQPGGYEAAFANHTWLGIGATQPALSQVQAPQPRSFAPAPVGPQPQAAPPQQGYYPQGQQPPVLQTPPPQQFQQPQQQFAAPQPQPGYPPQAPQPSAPAFWVPPGGNPPR